MTSVFFMLTTGNSEHASEKFLNSYWNRFSGAHLQLVPHKSILQLSLFHQLSSLQRNLFLRIVVHIQKLKGGENEHVKKGNNLTWLGYQ